MARPKKTAPKKATTRKAPARKATARKAATPKKATPKAKATKAKTAQTATRRPDANLPPSPDVIDGITNSVLSLIERLEGYAANLRALDRQRHNGVGLKRLGFIEAAFRLSSKFPQYFPHWLDTEKFQSDLDLFNAIRSLVEVCRSLEEKAWNINVESSDMIYTNALEYYSQVQDASRRRIDSAESIYNELHGFFHHRPTESEQPTRKKVKRDINALERGTKDGEVIVRNFRPKLTGGKREIIDETFRDSASYKETGEGSLTE